MIKAVDLFSGWGGFTEGAQQAGVEVVWCGNHWQLAVDVHASNHPTVQHVCQDLRLANWTSLPQFDLLLASPACQPHSSASRPQPRGYHDAMRSTAWAVVECADVTEPKAIIVENVTQFLQWRLYPSWADSLKRLGYHLSTHVLTATNHGVPQRRQRLFIVAQKKPGELALPRGGLAEPAFGPCLQTSAGGWRPVARAALGARIRILGAVLRHGDCLVQHVTGHPGVPLAEPIRTITTKDQWVVAEYCARGDHRYRPLTTRELARGMGFPDHYKWPEDLSRANVIRGLGNAVPPPVARDLITCVAQHI